MSKQLLIGLPEGTLVRFKVVIGFDQRLQWQDVLIVREFNTSIQECENVLCTYIPDDVTIVGKPSTNDNLLDLCVNRPDGEVVTIGGSICPVRNNTCVDCLYIKEIDHDSNNLVEIWVCPFSCRNIDQCKLSK